MPSTAATAPDRVEIVREFNRFYTRRIGVLHEGLLKTPYTLTESRLLWELAHRDDLTASELAQELDLDPGYLSRLLRSFKERGLVKTHRSDVDARHQHLNLTAAGKRAFAPLDTQSRNELEALLRTLTEQQQQQLLESMARIEHLLDDKHAQRKAPYLLRAHRPGDIGWVISRHGALYAQEFAWTMEFEALVARIAADFIERYDPKREACWIAERGGVNVGCVFVVQARDEETHAPIEGTAQLRMLLVEPSARGLGIGEQLVAQCDRFARDAGYKKIMLWTNRNLTAARSIYRKIGYQLIRTEEHHSFGHDLVGEIWEMPLRGSDVG